MWRDRIEPGSGKLPKQTSPVSSPPSPVALRDVGVSAAKSMYMDVLLHDISSLEANYLQIDEAIDAIKMGG